MSLEELNRIISMCQLETFGHKFEVRSMVKGDGFLLQLECNMADNNNVNHKSIQRGGKYYVSRFAIKDEVVGVLWKAMQDFIIHEAREGFLYRGMRIFGPHMNVESLHHMCSISSEVKRQEKYGNS